MQGSRRPPAPAMRRHSHAQGPCPRPGPTTSAQGQCPLRLSFVRPLRLNLLTARARAQCLRRGASARGQSPLARALGSRLRACAVEPAPGANAPWSELSACAVEPAPGANPPRSELSACAVEPAPGTSAPRPELSACASGLAPEASANASAAARPRAAGTGLAAAPLGQRPRPTHAQRRARVQRTLGPLQCLWVSARGQRKRNGMPGCSAHRVGCNASGSAPEAGESAAVCLSVRSRPAGCSGSSPAPIVRVERARG